MFLDDLPKKDGVGKNIGNKVFDWDKSVGRVINFTYDDMIGNIEILNIEILNYKKAGQYLTVKYLDKEYEIKTSNLQNNSIGRLINKFSKDFKIELGRAFKDDKRDLIIIDREYRKKEQKPDKKGRVYAKDEKWYLYHCNKCNYEGLVEEGSLLSQRCGCSCCNGKTAVLGINTIWDTDRWMCDLGVSEEDAKKYTRGSHKKVIVKCPDCGNEKEVQIDTLSKRRTISCSCNNSGFSYPEKFMAQTLNQLKVNYIYQLSKKTFSWCNGYRYDFYLPDYNMIIETHGEQHYRDCGWAKVKEVRKNDKHKKNLALNNKIHNSNYIVIDCRFSELEYIKNNILKSKLSHILNLEKINWLSCQEFALSNKVYEVCEYWRNKKEWETTKDLARAFKISDVTIRNYLNDGAKLNWCKYDGKSEMRKSGKTIGGLQKKKVNIFKDNICLGTFSSCTELSKESEKVFGTKLSLGHISAVCTGQRKSHKGFTFKYISDNISLSA